MSRSHSVIREGNTIVLLELDSPQVVAEFTRDIKHAINKSGYQALVVETKMQGAFYPNVVVPICGVIDFYKSKGTDINVVDGNHFSRSVLSAYSPGSGTDELKRPLSKIWRFSDTQEVCDVQKALIEELRKEEIFAPGVLEGIEWSINEVMDNVLIHSKAGAGFIMGQLHKTTKHVAFTIYDSGIGIYNSFKGTKHNVRSNIDALSLCLQEGVTRDSKVGQGNGLAGLFSLIKKGNGILNLCSGEDIFSYKDGEQHSLLYQNVQLSKENKSTTIDFQIDYSKEVSIDSVLTFHGKSFPFINLFLEDLEDDNGTLVFLVAEMSEGTGTRESAERLKNQIVNSMQVDNKKVIIDFQGVEVVSSSFIDELIAKLFLDLGLFQFNQRIQLRNMSMLLQKTLQKSVLQRIIEDFS